MKAGLKSEGLFAVLWLRNASGVGVYGYGGNACPGASYPAGFAQRTPSLFRVDDSEDVTLVDLTSYAMAGTLVAVAPRALGAGNSDRACLAPDQWVGVAERRSGRDSATQPLDRPVLWRRTRDAGKGAL